MSICALNWAIPLKLPNAGMKVLLIALANFSDEDGIAYPSQKTLADISCMSERAVRDNLSKLEAMEVIKRVPRTRANGSYTTDLFQLSIGMEIQVAEVESEISGDDSAAKNPEKTQRQILPTADSADGRFCQTQRQILPNPAAESAGPEPSLNTTITKNNQPARTQAREAMLELGVRAELAERWLTIRDEKKQGVPDKAALEVIQADAWLVGLRLDQAIECCVLNGWAWFRARWYSELPNEKKLGGTRGPPKTCLAEKDWRDSTDGVNKRGSELGIVRQGDEDFEGYRKRVIDANWKLQQEQAKAALERFKASEHDEPIAA